MKRRLLLRKEKLEAGPPLQQSEGDLLQPQLTCSWGGHCNCRRQAVLPASTDWLFLLVWAYQDLKCSAKENVFPLIF